MPVVAHTITYNSLVYTYYDEPATEYRKVTNRIIHFRPTKNLDIVSFTNGTDVVIHLETGHPVCAFNCACAVIQQKRGLRWIRNKVPHHSYQLPCRMYNVVGLTPDISGGCDVCVSIAASMSCLAVTGSILSSLLGTWRLGGPCEYLAGWLVWLLFVPLDKLPISN